MPGSAPTETGADKPRQLQAIDDDPPEDRYDPSPVEATREREQGLGMGERDLERQRDAHRPSAPPDEDDRPDGE
jgi:hypothetical protein